MGAKAFVGYNEDAEAVLAESFRKYSVRCDNYALILFLNSYPLKTAVKIAKAYYTKVIDKIYEANPLIAASLVRNREVLMLIGDGDLTINHLCFFYNQISSVGFQAYLISACKLTSIFQGDIS